MCVLLFNVFLLICWNDQENWYMSWHLDILIVWALAKVGETSKARELLEGLKLRLA